jgi:uncharacterized protein YifE (UPF0438 family)
MKLLSLETYKKLSVREQIKYYKLLYNEIKDVNEFEKIWRKYDPQYVDRRRYEKAETRV